VIHLKQTQLVFELSLIVFSFIFIVPLWFLAARLQTGLRIFESWSHCLNSHLKQTTERNSQTNVDTLTLFL